MPNPYFQFKQFIIHHDRCAMKVTTDACLFGAWSSDVLRRSRLEGGTLLDIGTGTGLLSLMIAQKNELVIDGIEIDKAAAEQAADNVLASVWRDYIRIIHAAVQTWEPQKTYDIIVSNPPFYEGELKSGKKTRNVAHHDEGLKLAELLLFIKNHLSDEGIFFLLLPAKRETEINLLLRHYNFHLHQKVRVKQSTNHTPFRIMLQAGRKSNKELIERDIAIKDSDNIYTEEFIALLKDYYLCL